MGKVSCLYLPSLLLLLIMLFSTVFSNSMADVLGRRPLYLITLAIYICANIGLALTKVYWLLMVLRCVQATGSASMIALSQGTVADIASPSERGGMVAIANSGAMLAPAIGPVIGSLLVSVQTENCTMMRCITLTRLALSFFRVNIWAGTQSSGSLL